MHRLVHTFAREPQYGAGANTHRQSCERAVLSTSSISITWCEYGLSGPSWAFVLCGPPDPWVHCPLLPPWATSFTVWRWYKQELKKCMYPQPTIASCTIWAMSCHICFHVISIFIILKTWTKFYYSVGWLLKFPFWSLNSRVSFHGRKKYFWYINFQKSMLFARIFVRIYSTTLSKSLEFLSHLEKNILEHTSLCISEIISSKLIK